MSHESSPLRGEGKAHFLAGTGYTGTTDRLTDPPVSPQAGWFLTHVTFYERQPALRDGDSGAQVASLL